MKKIFLLFASFASFYLANGQTILNGSFENNTAVGNQINLSNAAFTAKMANCTSFGTYGDIDIITTNYYCGLAEDGLWYIAFTGSGTDRLAMKLSQPLIAGNTYTLTFYDRGCTDWTPYPFNIGVSATDTAFGTTVLNGTQTPVIAVWTKRTVTFTAPNNGQYLTVLMNGGGTGDWAHVDNFCLGSCGLPPVASFQSSDTAFCDEAGKCIDFFDHSTGNPTSWQWIFAGATPSTSALQNPTNICYYVPGTYEVKLIASNGSGSDTLDVLPHIIFGVAPPPPVITVIGGDTLISTHCTYYQWYRDGLPIGGAIDSFYLATQAGTYSVQGRDSLGCVALSNGVLITDLFPLSFGEGLGVRLFPNPVTDELTFSFSPLLWRADGGEAVITDRIGQELGRVPLVKSKTTYSFSMRGFSNGVYFLQLSNGATIVNKKFVVLHN